MLPRKLQSVGYVTHHIGKWHLGMAMTWQTPFGRGFNTSLGYLGGGEDHYTQGGMKQEWGCFGTDLYGTHAPAFGGNGTYGGYLYNDAAVRIIEQHPESGTNPMFMYLATQTMHNPTQVPSYYSDMYPSNGPNGRYTETYAISNGMATVTDSILANVTLALKRRGMWNRTLVIHLSDNGGPVWKSMAWHANNYPLRGGKHTNWEGGVRVVAFASGGFLPASRHGKVLHGVMHNADWYPTLATLAGASPEDPPARGVTTAVPGVDGFDMWPYITGAVPTSPRSEVVLDSTASGGIISGDLKLVLGVQRFSFWQAPVYPNASGGAEGPNGGFDCGKGCLFNVTSDPSEYSDLAAARPADVARLRALFEARTATAYTPPQTPQDAAACSAKVTELGGYLGPYYTFAPALALTPASPSPLASPVGWGSIPPPKLHNTVRNKQPCNASMPLSCSLLPTGNTRPTNSAFSVQGTTSMAEAREFLVNMGLTSNTGAYTHKEPNINDKVTLYAGIVGEKGTGDIWIINPLLTQTPGSGDYNAQGIELDLNNENAHRGDVDGAQGLAPPVTYGLSITGASKFRSTAAISVMGEQGQWNRGIVFAGDAVNQSTFQDLGRSHQKSIDIRGSPVYGVYQASPKTKNLFRGNTSHEGELRLRGPLVVERDVSNTPLSAVLSIGGSEELASSGVVVLTVEGNAIVEVEDKLCGSTLSKEHSYQLTAVGRAMPNLHIARELAKNHTTMGDAAGGCVFTIGGGGTGGGKVSWRVHTRARST
jgi:arylsulfatase I/J